MALAVIIWHFLKKLTLCRVTADDGTYGGARHMQRRKEPVTKNMIGAVGRVVEGHSVFENRHLTRTAFDDFQIRRSAVDHYAAWSIIEIACWDIVGKICKRPVYNLLGGTSSRSCVRIRKRMVVWNKVGGRYHRALQESAGCGVHSGEVVSVFWILGDLYRKGRGGAAREYSRSARDSSVGKCFRLCYTAGRMTRNMPPRI